jgi:Fe-S cluster assembly ATP-binding protein
MSIIIKDLHAKIGDTEILKGLTLEIPTGEVHAIMGPNGSGKSTLSKVIAGHEDYEVTSGSITMDGVDVLEMGIDERSRKGIFLAFQYPMEIPGVSNANFIRAALSARLPDGEELDAVAYYKDLYSKMDALDMERSFTARAVNEGFSGGEKKRNEVLQMMMLAPKYCILDETDSGLDIDALKVVSSGVNMLRNENRGFLVITHYQRLLNYIKPDAVHVLADGKIIKSGGPELALELEERGYDHLTNPAAV